MEYKVGDRVKTAFGVGTIVANCEGDTVLVKHDICSASLHRGQLSLGYESERDDCYIFFSNKIKREDERMVTITSDGKTVTATSQDKKGIAKCSPSDTFDFVVGAKFALERLLFKPYLCEGERHYGIIGKTTEFKDLRGKPLFVGDTVEVYDKNHRSYGEFAVVSNENNEFVRGLRGIPWNNGYISDGWIVIKKRSYTEIKNNEKVEGITYIKEAQ